MRGAAALLSSVDISYPQQIVDFKKNEIISKSISIIDEQSFLCYVGLHNLVNYALIVFVYSLSLFMFYFNSNRNIKNGSFFSRKSFSLVLGDEFFKV